MPPETKTDCETKKHHLAKNWPFATVTRNSLPYIFDMITISFVCHQKPHSLQPNKIYGNLITNIRKS
jgi:hypothetical protein